MTIGKDRTLENKLRRTLVARARSLFARGYSFGSSGNISARCGNCVLVSPTGSSFETMTPKSIAKVDLDGHTIGPNRPSKEAHFHLAIYRARPEAGAVVHLHSTFAVAVSCLRKLDMDDAMPVLTPYYAMRIGRLPVVDYYPPGDPRLAPEVGARASTAKAILLRNHGPITIGHDLEEAAALAEELEEQAKLHILIGRQAKPLNARQIAELQKRFR